MIRDEPPKSNHVDMDEIQRRFGTKMQVKRPDGTTVPTDVTVDERPDGSTVITVTWEE